MLAEQLVLGRGGGGRIVTALGQGVGGEVELGLFENVPAALVPEFVDDVGRDEVVGRGFAEGRDGRGDQGAGVDDEVLDGALAGEGRLLFRRGHRDSLAAGAQGL